MRRGSDFSMPERGEFWMSIDSPPSVTCPRASRLILTSMAKASRLCLLPAALSPGSAKSEPMAASSSTVPNIPSAGSSNISMWWLRCPFIIGGFLSNTTANSSDRSRSPLRGASSRLSAESQTVCDVLTVLNIKNQFAMLLRLPIYFNTYKNEFLEASFVRDAPPNSLGGEGG